MPSVQYCIIIANASPLTGFVDLNEQWTIGHTRWEIFKDSRSACERYGVVQADLCIFKPERFTFAPKDTLFKRAWDETDKLQPLDESVKVKDELKFSNEDLDDEVIDIILALSKDALAGRPATPGNKARKRPRTSDASSSQNEDETPGGGGVTHILDTKANTRSPANLSGEIVCRLYDYLWKKPENLAQVVEEVDCKVPDPELSSASDGGASNPMPHQTSIVRAKFIDLSKIPDWPRKFPWRGFVARFLVREEYLEFDKFVEAENPADILLVGHPGIGKTIYLLYCLLVRLSKGRRTVFALDKERRYLFEDSGVYWMPHISFGVSRQRNLIQYDEDTLILFDCNDEQSRPTRWHDLRMLVSSSPRPKRYKDWKKHNDPLQFVMKPWEWHEIYLSRNLHGSQRRDEDEWYMAFLKYGGSARNLFRRSDKAVLEGIKIAIRNCNSLERLITSHTDDFQDTTSSWLVEMVPSIDAKTGQENRNYMSSRIISPYILDMLIEAKDARFIDDMSNMFKSFVDCDEAFKQSAGRVFEKAVHKFLLQVCDEQIGIRSLVSSTNETLDIAHVEDGPRRFGAKDRDLFVRNEYYLPISKNLTGINSYAFEVDENESSTIIAFQITIAQTHIVNLGFLQLLWNNAPPSLKIRKWKLIFVVPKENEPNFVKQRLRPPSSEDLWNERIDQYVLGVEPQRPWDVMREKRVTSKSANAS